MINQLAKLPAHIDAQTNDGVVNAARQLIDPENPGELCGVVVADHFDVLGYYDRSGGTDSGEPAQTVISGLLHSGSCFRDSEFFALYRLIGDAILTQCERAAVHAVPAAKPAAQPSARRPPSRRPTA